MSKISENCAPTISRKKPFFCSIDLFLSLQVGANAFVGISP